MGKTLDALLGRRSSKLATFLKNSITRIELVKNRHEALLSFSYSDIIQLLKLGYEQEALLRVEHVIKTKNMLDLYAMIESYCHLLLQRVSLIDRSKDCPDELKEAISSLIFASVRIGEFPELQHIRDFFSSKFGKEYVSQAIEFPRFLGVNDKMMQKLTTTKPSFETRMRFLRGITSGNGIDLDTDAGVQGSRLHRS